MPLKLLNASPARYGILPTPLNPPFWYYALSSFLPHTHDMTWLLHSGATHPRHDATPTSILQLFTDFSSSERS